MNWTFHRLWKHQFELYVPWTVMASVWSGHVMDCEGISLKAWVCVQAHGLWRCQFELDMPWTVKVLVWTRHAMDCEHISLNYACHGLWRHQFELCMPWTVNSWVCVHVLNWEGTSLRTCSGLRVRRHKSTSMFWTEKAQVCVHALDW